MYATWTLNLVFLTNFVKGLLSYYGLPLPHSTVEVTTASQAPPVPHGLKFELNSLPVRTSIHLTFLFKLQFCIIDICLNLFNCTPNANMSSKSSLLHTKCCTLNANMSYHVMSYPNLVSCIPNAHQIHSTAHQMQTCHIMSSLVQI